MAIKIHTVDRTRKIPAQDVWMIVLDVKAKGRGYNDFLGFHCHGIDIEITGTTLHDIFLDALSQDHNKHFRALLKKHIDYLDAEDREAI